MSTLIHSNCISNFDIENLPLITDAWSTTSGTDVEVILELDAQGRQTPTNSIMVEVKADTWVVIDGTCPYPFFADQPLQLSLKTIRKLKFIGTDVSYRFIAMTY